MRQGKLREQNGANHHGQNGEKARRERDHNTISHDVNEVGRMAASLRSKFGKTKTIDEYDTFFKNGALLKLPPVHKPIVCVIDAGKTTFIAQNDAHSKESNFGFKRNEFGGFYNH
jgi:hypothetical protein